MKRGGGYQAGDQRAEELPPPPPSICVQPRPVASNWTQWCDCQVRRGPHVHFPNWDADPRYGMIMTALVDTATGMEVPGSRR